MTTRTVAAFVLSIVLVSLTVGCAANRQSTPAATRPSAGEDALPHDAPPRPPSY